MSDVAAVRLSDPYRVVLLALVPGLVAGTVSSLVLGYGVAAPNIVIEVILTYAYLLLWSTPVLPLMALALVRWIPRGHPIHPWRPRQFFAFLVASVWHLIVLEVITLVDTGRSLLVRTWDVIAAAHIPATSCTVAAWVLYISMRDEQGAPGGAPMD